MCLLLDLLSCGSRPLVLIAPGGWGREEEVKETSQRDFPLMSLGDSDASTRSGGVGVGYSWKVPQVSFQRVPLPTFSPSL